MCRLWIALWKIASSVSGLSTEFSILSKFDRSVMIFCQNFRNKSLWTDVFPNRLSIELWQLWSFIPNYSRFLREKCQLSSCWSQQNDRQFSFCYFAIKIKYRIDPLFHNEAAKEYFVDVITSKIWSFSFLSI